MEEAGGGLGPPPLIRSTGSQRFSEGEAIIPAISDTSSVLRAFDYPNKKQHLYSGFRTSNLFACYKATYAPAFLRRRSEDLQNIILYIERLFVAKMSEACKHTLVHYGKWLHSLRRPMPERPEQSSQAN